MSLLMDALRKAEEAKKKAAQEDESEETAPAAAAEKQQPSVVAEKASVNSSVPEIKLSIQAMEEVSVRSAVPNLKTPIDIEAEEDYALPTSVGANKESVADSDANFDQNTPRGNEASVEPRQINPNTGQDAEASGVALRMDSGDSLGSSESVQQQKSKPVRKSFGFDSFESEEDNTTTSTEAASDIAVTAAASGTKKYVKTDDSGGIVTVAEQARERSRGRDEPRRKSARSVFAAKKSPLLKNSHMKVAVGGGLAIAIIVFSTYFYISLNQESAFNIPVDNFATTEFVDDGNSLGTDADQLSIEANTVTESAEPAGINVADSAPELLVISGGGDVDTDDTSAAPSPSAADTLLEYPGLQFVAIPEASRSAANLQPETIVQEMPPPTVADTPAVAVKPVASIGVQSAAAAEPVNLVSFRRQETVVLVDPNVDRAYAAYQQGSLDQAEALYRQTLASDPRQRDALLGLANITARNGNSTEALDLYSRLLARNPNDPIARAELMELLPAGRPSQQEAELKRLLNEHPDVAALSYAYGNFLASNQRWSEAQQAYFRALQLAKVDAILSGLVNPDYAFNLAVSLEHLNQSEPAQNYYREALDYSANHPAGFDLTAVSSRLANMAGNGNDE